MSGDRRTYRLAERWHARRAEVAAAAAEYLSVGHHGRVGKDCDRSGLAIPLSVTATAERLIGPTNNVTLPVAETIPFVHGGRGMMDHPLVPHDIARATLVRAPQTFAQRPLSAHRLVSRLLSPPR